MKSHAIILEMTKRVQSRTPLGESLSRARTARGITQRELAKMTGVSYRVIAHYETVVKNPSPDVVVKIAKALKVSADELMGLKPLTQKEPPVKNRRLLKKMKTIDDSPRSDQQDVMKYIDMVVDRRRKRNAKPNGVK